jgi:hypothetical protein
MKCPTCPDDRLVMTERSGIEIDYCPTCRGVWLDRGELDKIIERSALTGAPPPVRISGGPRLDDRDPREPVPRDRDDVDRYDRDRYDRDRYDDDRYDDDRDGGNRRPKKRRESLLSELFDF